MHALNLAPGSRLAGRVSRVKRFGVVLLALATVACGGDDAVTTTTVAMTLSFDTMAAPATTAVPAGVTPPSVVLGVVSVAAMTRASKWPPSSTHCRAPPAS